MTSPALAVEIGRLRWYFNPHRHEGAPVYRSVSHTTGALPKEGLKFWAANEVAQYAIDHFDSWKDLPVEDQYELLRKCPWRQRDRAAARGTTIHGVIEKMVNGEDFDVEAKIAPWIGAAQAFIYDSGLEPGVTERTIFNERHLFAGTFDYLGRMRKWPEMGTCLIDWKNSKGVYDDMGVQLVGGYALGAEYMIDDSGQEVEWRRPDTAAIVHLTPSGYQFRPVELDDRWRRAFLACLEIRKWEQEGPKIGEARQLIDQGQERFDGAYLGAEVEYLKKRVKALPVECQMELQASLADLGIPTRPGEMTAEHVDRVLGLVRLYEMDEKKGPASERRRTLERPIP